MRFCVLKSVPVILYVARSIPYVDGAGILNAPKEFKRRRILDVMEPVGPYLSTNHHRRTLPISSASSTKAAMRVAMSTLFASLCAATSFQCACSSS